MLILLGGNRSSPISKQRIRQGQRQTNNIAVLVRSSGSSGIKVGPHTASTKLDGMNIYCYLNLPVLTLTATAVIGYNPGILPSLGQYPTPQSQPMERILPRKCFRHPNMNRRN